MHGDVAFVEQFASELAGALAHTAPDQGATRPELLIFPVTHADQPLFA